MMDDTECDTFAKGPVEISFENSLLAIVKSNRYVPDQNEVTFSLSFWDKSLNITPARNNDDGPINDIQTISSVFSQVTSLSQISDCRADRLPQSEPLHQAV